MLSSVAAPRTDSSGLSVTAERSTADSSSPISELISSSRRTVAVRRSRSRSGSSTGSACWSQITDAVRSRVTATCSSTRRASRGSIDQSAPSIMAVLPATHSTRPTSFDTATAPEAAPVGG